jgi:predicted site-specific integrase-resolvase
VDASRFDKGRLLSAREAAAMFGVTARTLTRWRLAGKVQAIRTADGLLLYRESEIRAVIGAGFVPEQRRRT